MWTAQITRFTYFQVLWLKKLSVAPSNPLVVVLEGVIFSAFRKAHWSSLLTVYLLLG